MPRPATTRTMCEERNHLDISWLQREGILEARQWRTVRFSLGDTVISSIMVVASRDGLRLSYTSNGRAYEETMPIARTATNFRGSRVWFQCLGCQKRCRVLYSGPRYRCRKCHDLGFRSQYEPAYLRTVSRIQKVRRRMGQTANLSEPITPKKPKHMHWATYRRLEALEQRLQTRAISQAQSFVTP